MCQIKRFSRPLLLLLIGTLSGFSWCYAQADLGIQTQGGFSVEELVKNVFAEGGVCDNIFNIQRIGHPDGVGYFENGSSSIGLDRGIILSTGPISNAEGPNSVTDKSGNFSDHTGDPYLSALTVHAIKDHIGIEFDFIPLDSFVTFRYVFASEEYCEFVGSIYNDVFGFFISGPGITGGFAGNSANVALIPGSNDFVAINTVNHQQNSAYYIRNERPEDASECGIPATASPYTLLTEYDGFTAKLTAVLRLSPCQSYHIRLVVADVADNYYDSAVFLEAGSFNLGGQVTLASDATVRSDLAAYEGCSDGYFIFSRAIGQDNSYPLTVNFAVSPTSQATPGLDFAPLPGSVTIPAGQQSVHLPVHILNDTLNEGAENLTLTLDIPCACYIDSAQLTLLEPPPFSLDLPVAYACENADVILSPAVQGGIGPYSYLWSTQATASSISVLPQPGARYWVQISDQCGHIRSDTTQIVITPPPTALLSGMAHICQGDTAFLPMVLTGTPPWSLSYTVDGVLQPVINNILTPNYLLPATLGGLYLPTNIADQACPGNSSGQALIDMTTLDVDAQIDSLVCFGDQDAAISVQIAGGQPPYFLQWDQGLGSALQVTNLAAGFYTLTVVDQQGCDKTLGYIINEPPPLQQITVNCEQLANGILQLTAGGGAPPYQYGINGGSLSDASVFESLIAGQSYDVLIEDSQGCRAMQTLIMPQAYTRMVELPEHAVVKLGSSYTFEPSFNVPFNTLNTFNWQPSEPLSCSNCPQPRLLALEGGLYTLLVTDIFGCEAQAQILIEIDYSVDVFIPNAFSPNNDHVNDLLTIFANPYQVQEIVEMTVYDRWGGMLYQAHHFAPNETRLGWDGTARGRELDPGVYLCVVKMLLVDGSHRYFSAETILLR